MRHLAISDLKVSKNILEGKSPFFFQGWMVNGDDPTGVTFSLMSRRTDLTPEVSVYDPPLKQKKQVT